MIDNQLVEEVIKKLFSVQNKLKNSIIKNTFKNSIESDSFTNDNFSFIIDEYIKNKNKIMLFSDKELNELYQELKNFISYTENETKIINNRVALLDSINIIIYYFNKLKEKPDINVRVINQSEISENEFSKRYDRLMNLLNESPENSNLILYTKSANQPFKLFKNTNNSITINTGISENNNISEPLANSIPTK